MFGDIDSIVVIFDDIIVVDTYEKSWEIFYKEFSKQTSSYIQQSYSSVSEVKYM